MSFWTSLFGGNNETQHEAALFDRGTACPHTVLAPRWDSVAGIGHEDRAIGYSCTACGTFLSLEQADEAREREHELIASGSPHPTDTV